MVGKRSRGPRESGQLRSARAARLPFAFIADRLVSADVEPEPIEEALPVVELVLAEPVLEPVAPAELAPVVEPPFGSVARPIAPVFAPLALSRLREPAMVLPAVPVFESMFDLEVVELAFVLPEVEPLVPVCAVARPAPSARAIAAAMVSMRGCLVMMSVLLRGPAPKRRQLRSAREARVLPVALVSLDVEPVPIVDELLPVPEVPEFIEDEPVDDEPVVLEPVEPAVPVDEPLVGALVELPEPMLPLLVLLVLEPEAPPVLPPVVPVAELPVEPLVPPVPCATAMPVPRARATAAAIVNMRGCLLMMSVLLQVPESDRRGGRCAR